MIGRIWSRIIGRTPGEHLELLKLRLHQIQRGLLAAELHLAAATKGTNKAAKLKRRIKRLGKRVERWEKIVEAGERFAGFA